MKYVRTLVWVLLLIALVAFSVANWRPTEVKIWDGLILETKIPALVVVSFLLGLVPMWLIHRGTRWRLERRISVLESAHRYVVSAQPVTNPQAPTNPSPPESEPTVSP